MKSYWQDDCEIPKRDSLNQPLSCEVLIAGGGMSGILTAYFLKREGVQAVVVEADRIGSGTTKGTTAKITSQHGLCYHQITKDFGAEKAAEYASANQNAIVKYEAVAAALGIDCGFQRVPAYAYTCSEADLDLLKTEVSAARDAGIPAEFVSGEDITALPLRAAGAVRFPDQAQFHPLRFLRAVSQDLEIYEGTVVQEVQPQDDGSYYVRTNRPGGGIKAKQIVIATHFPIINTPGYYFLRMHQERSYVLGLKNARPVDGMYIGAGRSQVYSFRSCGDLLLFGGCGHRVGEEGERQHYEALKRQATAFYPDSVVCWAWSAQDCMPLDGIPYIGPYSEKLPGVFVATGYQKWGMSSAMAAAVILSDTICGTTPKYASVFDPGRFQLSASAEQLFHDTATSVKNLAKGVAGRNCAHLGCCLTKNEEEGTYDCPCHGSRFAEDGSVIEGPAVTPADLS